MSVGSAPLVGYPDWIDGAFDPAQVARAARLAWGFRNEVWRVALADGRDVAIVRFAETEAGPSIVSRTARLEPRLSAAGVPGPTVIDPGRGSPALLVTDFVEGRVGADLLDDVGGAALVGSILGATWRRLAGVDPSGLDLDGTWVRPDALVEISRARLVRVGPRLGGAAASRLGEMVDVCADLLAGRRATFVHGDLVPVNVIVRGGELAALLDFEFARVADPLLDAGWFDAVVAFHHPAEHPAAWQSFLAAAGIDAGDPIVRDLLRVLPTLRYLEILDDDATAPEHVPNWIAMLHGQLARA